MITAPFAQSIVSNFAPEDKRGRYMAIFGFSWAIPTLFGVLAAGVLMDNFNPNLVWYFGGLFSLIAAILYLLLNKPFKTRMSHSNEKKIISEITDQ